MTIDTRSSINVVDKQTFQQLRDIRLQPTFVKACPFNSSTPVKMEGGFCVLAESKHKLTVATVCVTSDDGGCLYFYSSETAHKLRLVSLHLNQRDNQTAHSKLTCTKDKRQKSRK